MKRKILVVSILGLVIPSLYSQISLTNSFDVRENFTQTITSNYFAENIEMLDRQEQLQFMPSKEVKDITIYSTDDGNREIEILHIEHNSLIPKWMKKPFKTIVNAQNSTSFDENGSIMHHLPHSEKINNYLSQLGVWNKPPFFNITSAEIDSLINKGYGVSYPDDSKIQISSPRLQMVIDETDLFYSKEIFDNLGQSVTREEFWYQIVEDEVVPLRQNYYRPHVTEYGICATKLNTVEYSNFSISKSEARSLSIQEDQQDNKILIFPNPTEGGLITLQANQSIIAKITSIKIIDVTGRQIPIQIVNLNDNNIQISIKEESIGVHMVYLFLENETRITKLIVQK